MKRRAFITLLGGGVAARGAGAAGGNAGGRVAQWRVARRVRAYVAAFRQGLQQAGYVEGQNVAIEYRWAEGHYDRLTEQAADLMSGAHNSAR
jgi:putative tryptophan/tyrosine transport system substrate-binding protein